MSAALLVLALVLAFLSGGVAATWAWSVLVLASVKRKADAEEAKP